MVEALKDKIAEVTKIQEDKQLVDDPKWVSNNDKRLNLEDKISQEQRKYNTAKKDVEELTPHRDGIATKMLHEEKQLHGVEKSLWGLGKLFFSKDIQNRKEQIEGLFSKWSDCDKKIKKAENIISKCKETITSLEKQRDKLIIKEQDMIQSYRKQKGLENNIDKSVVHRRQGMFRQTEKDPNNIPNNRKHGVFNKSNNQHSNQSTISKRNKVGVER